MEGVLHTDSNTSDRRGDRDRSSKGCQEEELVRKHKTRRLCYVETKCRKVIMNKNRTSLTVMMLTYQVRQLTGGPHWGPY